MHSLSSYEKTENNEAMLAEYDFSAGERGKHYQAYRQGYEVVIHKADGTTETQTFRGLRNACQANPCEG